MASRAMLNTGCFLWRARSAEPNFKLPRGQRPTFWAELLRDADYVTYMAGKWHVSNMNPKSVFDEVGTVRPGMPGTCEAAYERPKEGKSDLWQPWDKARGGFWQGGTHWSTVTANETIAFINKTRPDDKPFFIYAAFNAPHDPRQSPQEYVALYPPEKVALPTSYLPTNPHKDIMGCPHSLRDERLAPDPRTPEAVRVHRGEYYALITHLDVEIGRILDALEASGQATNTFVFLAGDNGLSVGQHGLMGKQSMFDHSMKVPLLVSGPGIPRNQRLKMPVYLQDVMPTTLELARTTVPDKVEFRSLLPLIKGERQEQYDVIYGAYMQVQRMVRHGDMKLVWYPKNNAYLLYDLANDPHEMQNLVHDARQAETVKLLKRKLAKVQQAMDDPLVTKK